MSPWEEWDQDYVCSDCGRANPGFLAFMTGWPRNIRYWCLYHIPWWARLQLWLRRG